MFIVAIISLLSYGFLNKGIQTGKDSKMKQDDHSLFNKEQDLSRQSAYPYGLPVEPVLTEQRHFQDENYKVAFKMAKYYRDLWEFLDEDADEQLDRQDLIEVFKMNKWPLVKGLDVEKTVDKCLSKFGIKKTNHLDFIEFCSMIEYLWSLRAQLEYHKCKELNYENLKIIDQVFDFCDTDSDKFLTQKELSVGLDKFMKYKVPEENYSEVIKSFSYIKTDESISNYEWLISFSQNVQFSSMDLNKLLVRELAPGKTF